MKFNYFNFFHIQEIENSKLLQLLFYCISFSFFVTFYGWISYSATTISSYINGTNVCPPYFLSCGKYYFLQGLPYGYTQGFFYVLLFLLLGYGVTQAIKSNWESAHKIILVTFLWKCIWAFVLTYGLAGNFDYYDMILAFVWLFLSNKEYFSKIAFIFLYFLASSIKIHEGWILGNYFNTLITGAPFLNTFWTPVFTNILIFMQMIGAWFLLSSNKVLQKLTYFYFMIFHIYSGIIVDYRYIAISIPALHVLFDDHTLFKIKAINKKTIAGYLFLLFLLGGQMISILIPGDQKKSLEGNYYGMYMFEANHQCFSNAKVYFTDSSKNYEMNSENHTANNRCDTYRYWYVLKTICDRQSLNGLEKISWTFDHSINGHPYERIVDEQNICTLEYKSFSHNDWIKIDNDAQVLNTPVYKNGYISEINKNIKIPAETILDNTFLENFKKTYWCLWYATIISIMLFLFYITYKKYE